MPKPKDHSDWFAMRACWAFLDWKACTILGASTLLICAAQALEKLVLPGAGQADVLGAPDTGTGGSSVNMMSMFKKDVQRGSTVRASCKLACCCVLLAAFRCLLPCIASCCMMLAPVRCLLPYAACPHALLAAACCLLLTTM